MNSLQEKMDKALETVLGQVINNLKPAEALAQAEAVLKMVQAREILMIERKEPPKK